MFTSEQIKKINEYKNKAIEKIETTNICTFKGHKNPVFLISDEYPGIWLEHVYDSVFYAKMNPKRTDIAKNSLNLFMDNQTKDGLLPCFIIDRNKDTVSPEYGYSQIQECVSFYSLCLEYYNMTNDKEFLKKSFLSGERWINWLETNRMPHNKGLIESFCGFDNGHDSSPRKKGIKYTGTAKGQMAGNYPDDDDVLPSVEPDVNAVFYGDLKAMEKIAGILNLNSKENYGKKAENVKKKIYEICYDEKDKFFYDIDKNSNARKILSVSITNIFGEHLLDKKDADEIYYKHLKNPNEFYTPYPFPSIAISDPAFVKNRDGNSWGYFSQALTALRCTRWMDYYNKSDDFDKILEKWIEGWTFKSGIMFGQELDPITGNPSVCSEWYSSCMLLYIYAAKRLKLSD